jgi:signal transduction histidine kinase
MIGLQRLVKRERQLSRLKSDFVANVSHELKTPLALIRMYAESLELGRVRTEEQKHKYYHIILRETERLSNLIGNVLHLSRIEAGKQVYKSEPCDLALQLHHTLEAFSEAFVKEGFTITSDIAQNLPPVQADPDAVSESLVNLIDNAMKYSESRREIHFSLRRSDSGIDHAIRDAGIGIDQKDLKHIFDHFYRVESHLTPKTRGSGIGLNLVHHFMAAQSGSISVISQPGSGSTFTLHFTL